MNLKQGTFISLIYKWLQHNVWPYWWNLALDICRNQNKVVRILTENHIKHDQIHHIRNNWLSSNFFLLGDSHIKGYLSCFIWDLHVVTDQKGRFVSCKFTPSNDKVLCVYAPSGYSTREHVDRRRFFEGLQNYTGNKKKGNKNKIILKTLILLWIKWTGMVKIKHRDFIGAAPVMPCQNSSSIMDLRIYGDRRAQNPLSSPRKISPLARIQDRQGLYWYKNCSQ